MMAVKGLMQHCKVSDSSKFQICWSASRPIILREFQSHKQELHAELILTMFCSSVYRTHAVELVSVIDSSCLIC